MFATPPHFSLSRVQRERAGERGGKMRLTNRAKHLRRSMTEAEHRLWHHLRAHRFAHAKFKRQVVIGRYIADFAAIQRRLIVEVDGGQHLDSASDIARTAQLETLGYRVLRFWNNDVLNRTDDVLAEILRALDGPLPNPSPAGRARG
jgi:very-short-patch-repair endonuclease